jgi:hypothetical protein
MTVVKALFDKLIGSNFRKTVLFWPLVVWVFLTELASAHNLSRGTQVRTWIEEILKPATEIAPYVVKTGEAFCLFFYTVLVISVIILVIRKKEGKIGTDEPEKVLSFMMAITMCQAIAYGWVGAFAIPYMPDLPGCIWAGNCTGNPWEIFTMISGMVMYLTLSIGGFIYLVTVPEKKGAAPLIRIQTISLEPKDLARL